MLYDAKDNKEEASLGHKGELSLSDSSENSDNKYEYDNRTGAEYIDCNGNSNGHVDGDGEGDRNTGDRAGSV